MASLHAPSFGVFGQISGGKIHVECRVNKG